MRSILLPLLAIAACDDYPRLAEDPDIPGSVLSGSVVTEETEVDAPTILLMSTEDAPMPPVGNGFPVTFSVINGQQWSPAKGGVRGAPFAFTNVDPGGWYLTGVTDTDRNFHPEVTALATPSCGDLVGWHGASLDTFDPQPVTVPKKSIVSDVIVGPLTPIVEPRPTFTIPADTQLVANTSFRMDAVAMAASFGELEIDVPSPGEAASDPCAAGFAFERADADGDGSADNSPLLPLIEDRWPRVIFLWLGEPVDSDDDGVFDSFDRGDVADGVTFAAIGDPEPTGGVALPEPGEAIRLGALDVTFTGFGQRIDDGGSDEILAGADLPSGAWGITVITKRGQLWTVPNEIDDRMLESRELPDPGLTSEGDPSQGVFATFSP